MRTDWSSVVESGPKREPQHCERVGLGTVTPRRYTSVMSDPKRLRQEDHKFESVSMT